VRSESTTRQNVFIHWLHLGGRCFSARREVWVALLAMVSLRKGKRH
jgi:hypothetical protein